MFSVFNKPVSYEMFTGDNSSVRMQRILPVLLADLINVTRYYRSQVHSVASQHMLNVLLEICTPPLEYEYYRYLDSATIRAERVAKLHGIYTSTQKGRRFKAKMYPHAECYEWWIHLDDHDYSDPMANPWHAIAPLKCLDHGYSDLALDIPNGRTARYGSRDSVWGIDITGMVMKYRGWALERQAQNLGISTMEFIHREVLPQALDSIIDIALINRYWCLMHGKPMTRTASLVPIQTTVPGTLDTYLKGLIRTHKERPERFTDVLRSIPTVAAPNALERLRLPSIARLDSNLVLMYYARLSHIENMVSMSLRVNRNNRDYISDLITDHKRIRSSKLFYRLMPEIANDVQVRLDELSAEALNLFEGMIT